MCDGLYVGRGMICTWYGIFMYTPQYLFAFCLFVCCGIASFVGFWFCVCVCCVEGRSGRVRCVYRGTVKVGSEVEEGVSLFVGAAGGPRRLRRAFTERKKTRHEQSRIPPRSISPLSRSTVLCVRLQEEALCPLPAPFTDRDSNHRHAKYSTVQYSNICSSKCITTSFSFSFAGNPPPPRSKSKVQTVYSNKPSSVCSVATHFRFVSFRFFCLALPCLA